jgi:hypothetical protein
LRYCRPLFFTFVLFVQKLSGISSCKNNKSCRIFHHESKKMVLRFSDFSTIFYAIYKKQESHFTIGVTLLQGGPQKESFSCNVVPGGGRPARLGQFRRGSSPAWPGKGWGGSYGPLGVDLGGQMVEKGRPRVSTPAARGRLRAARLAWVGARGGEGPTDSAGAARVRRIAGARPGTDGAPRLPVLRGQGAHVYKGRDLLAFPRPSRRRGAQGLGRRAR